MHTTTIRSGGCMGFPAQIDGRRSYTVSRNCMGCLDISRKKNLSITTSAEFTSAGELMIRLFHIVTRINKRQRISAAHGAGAAVVALMIMTPAANLSSYQIRKCCSNSISSFRLILVTDTHTWTAPSKPTDCCLWMSLHVAVKPDS